MHYLSILACKRYARQNAQTGEAGLKVLNEKNSKIVTLIAQSFTLQNTMVLNCLANLYSKLYGHFGAFLYILLKIQRLDSYL